MLKCVRHFALKYYLSLATCLVKWNLQFCTTNRLSNLYLQKYPITEYQPIYYVAESFESAKNKMQALCEKIPRPFTVRYNPYTQSIEILDTKDKVLRLADELQCELCAFLFTTFFVMVKWIWRLSTSFSFCGSYVLAKKNDYHHGRRVWNFYGRVKSMTSQNMTSKPA